VLLSCACAALRSSPCCLISDLQEPNAAEAVAPADDAAEVVAPDPEAAADPIEVETAQPAEAQITSARDALLAEVDANGDNVIDKDEFDAAMRSGLLAQPDPLDAAFEAVEAISAELPKTPQTPQTQVVQSSNSMTPMDRVARLEGAMGNELGDGGVLARLNGMEAELLGSPSPGPIPDRLALLEEAMGLPTEAADGPPGKKGKKGKAPAAKKKKKK
jgi:hypothetical protein